MTEPSDSEDKRRINIPMDSAMPDWLKDLPMRSRPFAALARWDRPIGIWLLFCRAGWVWRRCGSPTVFN